MDWWNSYIGIQFVDKGRGLTHGDCWNLVMQIYNIELGKILPGYEETYKTTMDKELIGVAMEAVRISDWVEVEKPKPFDVILLRMAGVPMHVGVVTKPGFMIHCSRDVNTVHERHDSIRWQNKIAGFFRHE